MHRKSPLAPLKRRTKRTKKSPINWRFLHHDESKKEAYANEVSRLITQTCELKNEIDLETFNEIMMEAAKTTLTGE